LERRLGRMTLENDFLKRAFKRVKEAHSKSNAQNSLRYTNTPTGTKDRALQVSFSWWLAQMSRDCCWRAPPLATKSSRSVQR
jgi:hypothetical protein